MKERDKQPIKITVGRKQPRVKLTVKEFLKLKENSKIITYQYF